MINGIIKGEVSQSDSAFSKNETLLSKAGISKEDLKEKYQLSKIASLADNHQQMTFEELAKELHCTTDEVEFLFISSIEYGFIDALIDQNTQRVFFRWASITLQLNLIIYRQVYKRNLDISEISTIPEKLNTIIEVFEKFSAQN